MAQCQGTTQSGEQCQLDAREGSEFCHLHGDAEEGHAEEREPEEATEASAQQGEAKADETADAEQEEALAADEALCWDDVAHLALAGVVVAGMFFFIRSFGKWIPKI